MSRNSRLEEPLQPRLPWRFRASMSMLMVTMAMFSALTATTSRLLFLCFLLLFKSPQLLFSFGPSSSPVCFPLSGLFLFVAT